MHRSYKKRTYVMSGTWFAIVAPMDCNFMTLRNRGSVDMLIRTIQDDAGTEDAIASGVQETANALYPDIYPTASTKTRFSSGDTVVWAKSTDGSAQTLTVTWIR